MKRCLTLLMATFAMAFTACAGDWIYDGTTSPATIRDAESDWNWKLEVSGPLTDGAITIGGYGNAVVSGSGVLDLRDMTVGGESVTALTLAPAVFFTSSTMTEFYANNVASDLSKAFANSPGITKIEISGDGVTALKYNSDGDWGVFEKCTGLVSLKLDTPNLTRIERFAFRLCSSLDCPTEDYIPRGVTFIGQNAFAESKINRDIVLDNITTIDTRAFLKSSITGMYINGGEITQFAGAGDGEFEKCYYMTNLVIKAPNFKSLGQYSVYDCTKLAVLYISSTNSISVDATVFHGGSDTAQSSFSVTFEGPAPEQSAMDTLLYRVGATSGSKACALYCSKRQTGWTGLAAELTDTETAATPPANCFGVYRDGSRKAWMVDIDSPYDPAVSGSVFVVSTPTGVGNPSPEFGQHEEVEDGTTFTTAEYVLSGDDLYHCVSYQIEELQAGSWVVIEEGAGKSWTYHTAENSQRITWVHELCGGKLFFSGEKTPHVTVSPEAFFEDAYTNGTPMTVTAVDLTDPTATFVSWGGSLPSGCSATSRTINFAFAGTRTLTVDYDCRDWKYYTDGSVNRITDHNWVFTSVFDETTGLLRLLTCTGGSGVLDLRNLSVNGTAVTGITIEDGENFFAGHRTVTHAYIEKLAANLKATFYQQPNLIAVELSGDGVTALEADGSEGMFDASTNLKSVRYDFPNLRKLDNFVFYACSALTNDIASLVPRSVTNIGHRVFIDTPNIRGCLTLDRCDYIGHGTFQNCGADEIRLGDGDLTHFCNYVEASDGGASRACGVFRQMPNLTNLVVDARNLVNVGTNAFAGSAKLKTISFASQLTIDIAPSDSAPALTGVKFEGPAPSADSLDNLLAGVTATDGKKTCVVEAPNKDSLLAGWQSLASPLVDGDEKDNAPRRCFGVYRADSRKAYLTAASANGFMIICR